MRVAFVTDGRRRPPVLPDCDLQVETIEPADWVHLRDADVVVLDARGADRRSLVGVAAASGRPVVALGSGDTSELLQYVDAGVDEYVPATATAAEFAARLRSVLRRSSAAKVREPADEYAGEGIVIDIDRHEVYRGGVPVRLTPAEFRILSVLAREEGKVVPHYRLASQVWSDDEVATRAHLRVHIRHLRQKLDPTPDEPRLLVTERGRGYALRVQRTGERPMRRAG